MKGEGGGRIAALRAEALLTVSLFGQLGRRQAAHLPHPPSPLFYLPIGFRQP